LSTGLDVHQQPVVAQVAPLRSACPAYEVLVVSRHTHLQNPAPGTRHPALYRLNFSAFQAAIEIHARNLEPLKLGPSAWGFSVLTSDNASLGNPAPPWVPGKRFAAKDYKSMVEARVIAVSMHGKVDRCECAPGQSHRQ
jgi:hypothetical protein